MLAVPLSVDAEGFAIEQENAAGCFCIRKNNPSKVMMEMLENGDVALRTCCPDPAKCAAIKDVPIVKSRGTFSAPVFHAEGALTGIALPSPTTPGNDVS